MISFWLIHVGAYFHLNINQNSAISTISSQFNLYDLILLFTLSMLGLSPFCILYPNLTWLIRFSLSTKYNPTSLRRICVVIIKNLQSTSQLNLNCLKHTQMNLIESMQLFIFSNQLFSINTVNLNCKLCIKNHWNIMTLCSPTITKYNQTVSYPGTTK